MNTELLLTLRRIEGVANILQLRLTGEEDLVPPELSAFDSAALAAKLCLDSVSVLAEFKFKEEDSE